MASRKQALQDFQTLILSIQPVAALVKGRVYSGQPPQGAPLPTLTLTVISAPTVYSQDGHESDETLIQIDIDGHSPTQCRDIGDAICNGISGVRTTVGETRFEGIFHDDVEVASVSESNVPGTTQAHRLMIDYRVCHRTADLVLTP